MSLLAINYHYIEETHYASGIYPTSPRGFEAQLEALAKYFRFVSGMDIVDAVEGRSSLPLRACIITFDDGLLSQYECALPVLDSMGIPALFFVCGRPLLERKALAVHKIHFVRANLSTTEILGELKSFFKKRGQEIHGLDATLLPKARAAYRYDDDEAALLKFFLNHQMDSNDSEEFISGVFSAIVANEADWCEKKYMNPNIVGKLAARNYLGSHTYAHLALATLSNEEMLRQVKRNQEVLAGWSDGSTTPFISYPYGSLYAISSREFDSCSKMGLKIGFTMERAMNLPLESPLGLARVDTNDVLLGKNSLMSVETQRLRIQPLLSQGRKRYLQESN